MIDQFPEPAPLPRQYWTAVPDPREDIDREWMADALCAQTDPELWFPPKGGNPRPGQAICNRCEVKEQCLLYALATGQTDGTWGGVNQRDLRRMRARKNGAAA